MQKLFSVEAGILIAPTRTRVLHGVITTAETEDDALQYAIRHYPEQFAQCPVHRVLAMKHMILDYSSGETRIEEDQPTEFHC